MREQSRAGRALHGAVICLVLLIGACSSTPPASPSPLVEGDPVDQLMAQPFSDRTVDAAISVLAASGIGTYANPEDTAPIFPVTGAASPVVFLRDQVQAMALEANVGGGFEGAELDSLVDTEADMAAPSYILAGYVAAADTDGSHVAQEVMGATDWDDDDWRNAPMLLFPQLVLALFTADVVRDREEDAAGSAQPRGVIASTGAADYAVAPLAAGFAPVAQAGACTAVSNFISGALTTVFNKLRLGEPARGIGRIFAKVWNFVVNILQKVVTTIVKEFEQKVLDAIGRVAAVVGAVSMIVSALRPWTMTVMEQPSITEKGIAGIMPPEEGQLIAKVELGTLTEWPKWMVDCANKADRPLPPLKPEGAPVTWDTLVQSPGDLVQEGMRSEALDNTGAAQLDFTTLTDYVEDPYVTLTGYLFAHVSFERPGIRQLADIAENELWKEIPSVVVGPLRAFLGPSMEAIKTKFVRLLNVSASGPSPVRYHVQQPKNACESPSGGTVTATLQRLPANVGAAFVAQADGASCAMSNGDPHIVTVNGAKYDLQAAGEFVLLKSADGSFEIQSRQRPLEGDSSFSMNSAVAMRIGDHRFGVYLDSSDAPLRTMLDGQPVELSGPTDVGSGRVTPNGNESIDIDFPDGTHLTLVNLGYYGINVLLSPSVALSESGIGVMGRVTGNNWLPNLPDGTGIARPDDRHQRYEALYVTFADAWRVQQSNSLFDYDSGQSTDTFTIRPFPTEANMFEFEDLLAAILAFAQTACADVSDETLNEQCVFDVGATEDEGYADAYETTFNVVQPTAALPDSTVRYRFANFFFNSSGPVAVDIYRDLEPTDPAEAPPKLLLATVPYGEITEWLDPGITEGAFGFSTFYDIYPHGETEGGVGVAATSGLNAADFVVVGTRVGSDESYSITQSASIERWPAPNEDLNWTPTEGQAAISATIYGLPETDTEMPALFVGIDGTCPLPKDNTFAEAPYPVSNELVLDVGTGEHSISIHRGNADGTFKACDQPIGEPQKFTFEAGQRVHLLIYGTSAEDPAFMLVPYDY